MYEMYPQTWGSQAERPASEGADKPRRRARRSHPVAPRVIRVAKRG
ncbi:MAG TPA: hypothetical protein IAA98_01800 [Candidatus Avipropionibacterium avicola]|uniref:Uncharacterized protein n=1 Tax=Candidatus Avipropionibacterium avicola TaxID=2840701 RepID=A0A9D1GXG3_9ACTN|nr:hypothetical protein [Candidatus Avipropionibacterium avicola]